MRSKNISLLGVPSDFGAKGLDVGQGPKAIRSVHLAEILKEFGFKVRDEGDIRLKKSAASASDPENIKFLSLVEQISILTKQSVQRFMENDSTSVNLGGDHGISVGTIAGAVSVVQPLGLIWVDAHGDANTPETSPSGNIHGMALAVALGYGSKKLTSIFPQFVNPQQTVLIGAKDLDAGEIEFFKREKVRYFTVDEIEERGIGPVLEEALSVVSRGTQGVHVSVDLDSVDQVFAPGVGMPNQGGFSYREMAYLCNKIGQKLKVVSLDVVELKESADLNQATAKLAVEIILRCLGVNFSYSYYEYLQEHRL